MSTSTDTAASARLGVVAAPAGLALAQDLLNSAAVPAFAVPDLLADASTAAAWVAQALDAWARHTGRPRPALRLGPDDLPGLREGRRRVRAWLAGEDVDLPSATVTLGSRGAEVTYAPAGDGSAGLLGLVVAELLLAQRDGSAARLKTCANPACGAAFYDRSRNSSRVWHDVRTCGNVTNLRASRARRRAAGTGQDQSVSPGS